jgi:hypothetical protein
MDQSVDGCVRMYVQMYAVDVAPDDGEVGDRRLGAADEGAAALLDEELELVKEREKKY